MKLFELNDMVAGVAPIFGINSNGVISFKPNATDEQKAAAQVVIEANITDLDPQDIAP